MAISKIKASELVKKWFSTPVTQIPAAEAPPSLVKVYPLANADTKAILETTPFGDLAAWTSSGYYNFPADTANVNSVKAIASSPAEFVAKTKAAAIAAAAKVGLKDPKFIVAQAAHEGGWGKNAIGEANIFGHVASESWTQKPGNAYSYERTWESIKKNGVATKIRTVRPFRLYPNLESAFDAHVAIIKQWPAAISADTIEKYATALVSGKTKYATDPDYVSKLRGTYNTVSQYWS